MTSKYEKEHADEHGRTSGMETVITCPYCGYEELNSWESELGQSETDDDYECGECDEVFSVTATITRTFQSEKKVPK